MKINKELLEEINNNIREDYIGFWIIYSLIEAFYPNDKNIVNTINFYIKEMLKSNFILIGEFEGTEFNPWKGNIEDKFSFFHKKWNEIEFKKPDIGDVCFFAPNLN